MIYPYDLTDMEQQYLNIFSFKKINAWVQIKEREGLSSPEEAKKKYKIIDGYIAEQLGLSRNKTVKMRQKLAPHIQKIQKVHDSKWYGDDPSRRKRREGFGNDLEKFYRWYEKQPRECFYCRVKENITLSLFKNKLIRTSKPSWTGHLEVERKDGSEYIEENCALICPLCNNAKSDLISSSNDFKKYIASGIRAYQMKLHKTLKNRREGDD